MGSFPERHIDPRNLSKLKYFFNNKALVNSLVIVLLFCFLVNLKFFKG